MSANNNSSFKEASNPPIRLGYKGEVSEMIERDMDLAEAAELMCEKWNFQSRLSLAHESSHLLLAMLLHTHPGLLPEDCYQGSFASEIYVLAMQDVIGESYSCRPGYYFENKGFFTQTILEKANRYYFDENKNRIIEWLLGQQAGKSAEHMKAESGHKLDSYNGVNPFYNSEISLKPKGFHVLEVRSTKHGVFKLYGQDNAQNEPLKVICPNNLVGTEPFVPFEIPSRETVDKIHDAVMPALHLIASKVYKFREALRVGAIPHGKLPIHQSLFSGMRIGEIIATMRNPGQNLKFTVSPWPSQPVPRLDYSA